MKRNLANSSRGRRLPATALGGNLCEAERGKVRKFVLTKLIAQPHAVAHVQANKLAFRHSPKQVAIFRLQPLDTFLDILPQPDSGITFRQLTRSTSWSAIGARPPPGSYAVLTYPHSNRPPTTPPLTLPPIPPQSPSP